MSKAKAAALREIAHERVIEREMRRIDGNTVSRLLSIAVKRLFEIDGRRPPHRRRY